MLQYQRNWIISEIGQIFRKILDRYFKKLYSLFFNDDFSGDTYLSSSFVPNYGEFAVCTWMKYVGLLPKIFQSLRDNECEFSNMSRGY